MKIDPKRISSKLSLEGFQLGFFDKEALDLLYVRKNGDFFERILIGQGFERGGARGDLVTAAIQCAITPGRTALKGMAEHMCLTEIAGDSSSGWTRLSSASDALRWETALVSIAPRRAEEFAKKVGAALVLATREAKTSATMYVQYCQIVGQTSHEMFDKLTTQANESQISEAKRIMSHPIVCIPGGKLFYETAALAIAVFSAEVEGDPGWLKKQDLDSWQDRELMFRLQIVASQLACEPGW